MEFGRQEGRRSSVATGKPRTGERQKGISLSHLRVLPVPVLLRPRSGARRHLNSLRDHVLLSGQVPSTCVFMNRGPPHKTRRAELRKTSNRSWRRAETWERGAGTSVEDDMEDDHDDRKRICPPFALCWKLFILDRVSQSPNTVNFDLDLVAILQEYRRIPSVSDTWIRVTMRQ